MFQEMLRAPDHIKPETSPILSQVSRYNPPPYLAVSPGLDIGEGRILNKGAPAYSANQERTSAKLPDFVNAGKVLHQVFVDIIPSIFDKEQNQTKRHY